MSFIRSITVSQERLNQFFKDSNQGDERILNVVCRSSEEQEKIEKVLVYEDLFAEGRYYMENKHCTSASINTGLALFASIEKIIDSKNLIGPV